MSRSEIHKPISLSPEDDDKKVYLNLPDVRQEDRWIYMLIGFMLGSASTVLGMLIYAFLLR